MAKTEKLKRILSGILCTALIAATAVFTGCGDDKNSSSSSEAETTVVTQAETEPEKSADGAESVGDGNTQFNFTVTGKAGNQTAFDAHTDKTTVGEALTELKLIDGEQGDYGLYVKTVNGETLDYDTDGYYWAFYVNGAYAQTGVDSTNIEAGASYELKAEKG